MVEPTVELVLPVVVEGYPEPKVLGAAELRALVRVYGNKRQVAAVIGSSLTFVKENQ